MDIQSIYELFLKNPIITTDSRNCPENSIFFALKGEKFNGNHFAEATIQQGCAFAFVDEEEYADGERIFYVKNTLETLQMLARLHRETLNPIIIGITGTNGKTTTKELTASVLKKKYNVHFTQGNLNNHIGVPLTLLQLKKEHPIAIIEMGANHPGEIKTLVDIARPNYGLITNVGKAHIEGFGSFEGVIKTKCELYDFLRDNNGTAFVNPNNEILISEIEKRKLNAIKYANPDSAKITSGSPFLSISWASGETTTTNLIGKYNFENALAAYEIGMHFEVEEKDILEALREYTPTNNRSQLKVTSKNELIIDAYNANPTSMKAALDNFFMIEKKDKCVILGDMKELGSESAIEHQKIADILSGEKLKNLILIGECFAQTHCPAAQKLDDINALKKYLTDQPINGQLILIKGSNSMKLAECVELL